MALQLLSPELMRSALCLAVIIAGVVLFSRDDSRTVSASSGRSNAEIVDARDTRRDVYGNDIAPAVADYLVDPYGQMYERHAPDTALLDTRELPPPGT